MVASRIRSYCVILEGPGPFGGLPPDFPSFQKVRELKNQEALPIPPERTNLSPPGPIKGDSETNPEYDGPSQESPSSHH